MSGSCGSTFPVLLLVVAQWEFQLTMLCCVPMCAVLCCAVQPGEDPFTIMRQEKRERIRTQQKQQLANVKTAMQAGGAAAVPATLRLAAALPTKGKGAPPTKRKELRDEVGRAS